MHAELSKYSQLVTHLELLESKLLTWGVVDGSFTRDELCAEIDRVSAEYRIDTDSEDFLEELIENRFVFEFNDGGRPRYRTRMAEAVRLFARLRQIRPWNTWQTAPTLVSDFRFAVAPRYYPKRDIPAVEALARIQAGAPLTPTSRTALGVLLRLGSSDVLTLADFQLKATIQILNDIQARITRGVVVTAGTGTGKTKAFYLPVLSYVASLVNRDSFWTKALALYPRNELLKDQYSETYSELVLINDACNSGLGRRLTTGVLFQDTPNIATPESLRAWQTQGKYICSSLRCPKCKEGSLEWTINDLHAQREVLTCVHCGFRSADGDLVLTRKSLTSRPPDLLFSTTEMLNRCMSDSRRSRLFGLGQPQAPRVVLLDEIHTYEGTHGAQVAHLLRRWRWAVRKNVQFTGLSATLDNAQSFFSQLTGVRPANVVHIPGNETEVRGMEYQLALRGDPVSATALLSTTIQAAMLLRRVLDVTSADSSATLFGQRTYVFTDNLDIVNRLYFDLRDAEGAGPTNPGITLASYRQHAQTQPRERLKQGQSWKLSEDIGHDLSRRLVVSRTSSQDTGVDRDADIVVATASLEVGYNDPSVGGIIQHKAPRDNAAFLQRKGRAGRRPEMRPWTIIALSDYGRDRFAYESYDQLFSPRLPERTLPLSSRYVLRMQAVFALMDWLARKMPANLPSGSVWRDLSGPSKEPWTSRQTWLRELMAQLLTSADLRNEFESYLKGALNLNNDQVIALLWEPPRSIMMAVVPTALRRLESNWRRVPLAVGDSQSDLVGDNVPLPDFIPPNLFSDLSLPEVTISPRNRGTPASIPIVQAMQIVAFGNVTRRFAPHDNCLHWCSPPDLNRSDQDVDVTAWCADYERLGDFQKLNDDGTVASIPCIRPLKFEPTVAPANVRATSKGFLVWQSQLFAPMTGLRHSVPGNSPWSRFVDHIEFYTHSQDSHVTVRRFAIGAQANVGFVRGRSTDSTINLRFRDAASNNCDAGVGFVQDVDGIAIRFRFPQDLRDSPSDSNREKIRCLRTAYFRQLVRSDSTLKQNANDFQLEWLSQMYLSAVSAEALENKSSLREAHVRLIEQGLGNAMVRVLDVIFQTLTLEDDQHDQKPPDQKTRVRLGDLAHNNEVSTRIAEIACVLWDTPDWTDWVRERFRATLGGALLEAFQRASSLFDAESLWLDLESGPPPRMTLANEETGLEEIWITEQTPGGTGIVEHILQRFAEDPTRFFRLAHEALGPGDFEVVDSEISRLVRQPQKPALCEMLRKIRDSITNEDLRENIRHLRTLLQRHGFVANHAVMAALQARVLRPGTTEDFDGELDAILTEWRAEEERLGIEIGLRVIAYVFGRHRQLAHALPFLPEMNLQDPQWRYQAYASILWPRGNVVRGHTLSWWNPFSTSPSPDRFLVLDCLELNRAIVDIHDASWREKIRKLLADTMEATLSAPTSNPLVVKEAVLSLMTEPLEVGFLHVFPKIEGASRRADTLELRVVCREAAR